MDWFDKAKTMYKPGEFGYKQIAKELGISHKTVESRFQREKKSGNLIIEQQPINLQDSILKELSRECAISYLVEKYKQSERVIRATIEDIKEAGYQITEIDGQYKLCRDIVNTENKHAEEWTGEKIIRFGVVSDNHLCSRWQQLTFLNYLYDLFKSEGIETVYNCGDITEGFKMRQGHEHEIFKYGADDQAQYVIDVYPERPGIVTKFITGNHDHSHIKNGGVDIGKRIADKRPDMIYLGLSNAHVNITPNCIVELNHPLDGAAYALSYAPQKTIDAMSGGEKPNILLNGHHHKIFYMMYRNIHCYETGTTQAQTPWMRGKRIAANVGGLIVEVHVDEEGTITRCKGEYIPQYKSIENDY
jgi:predicted phosphodiesterase/biotin operon repressor